MAIVDTTNPPPLPPLGHLPSSAPRKILLVKPSALGDVVTAIPVLRGLRRTFPNSRIAWFIADSCRSLIEQDRDLDDVVIFERARLGRFWRSWPAAKALWQLFTDLKNTRYDWVIDLQGLLRSGLFTGATGSPMRVGFADSREHSDLFYTRLVRVDLPHTVDRNISLARQLGVDARREDFSLQVSGDALQQVRLLMQRHGLDEKKFVICVPPTRWLSKRYPTRHWRKVVASLRQDMPVVLMGSPSQEERGLCQAVAQDQGPGVVDLAGQTNLPQMVAMIASAAGVICCDSSAKFIAPAVGVEALSLLGPTRVELTGPYLRGKSIVAEVPCQGCLRRRCRHNTCMELISPDHVLATARQMFFHA